MFDSDMTAGREKPIPKNSAPTRTETTLSVSARASLHLRPHNSHVDSEIYSFSSSVTNLVHLGPLFQSTTITKCGLSCLPTVLALCGAGALQGTAVHRT